MGNEFRDLADDLENWMSRLPQNVRQIPITNISIPGSHDSFTANITKDSDISPDAEDIVKELSILGPLFKEVIARWSRTQSFLANDQLIRGIRYFDIRTSTKEGTDEFYIVHSLYSVPLQGCLNEINAFLSTHPQEVVILDFQHFFGFDDSIHKRLTQDIINTFGGKLIPYTNEINTITLKSMASNKYQIFVIYRVKGTTFWPAETFPNPWPNVDSKEALINSLDNNLAKRNPNIPFISQCVLTPDAGFIIANFLSSLEEKCAKELELDRLKWIEAQKAGRGGLNIIIADFIELSDCKYVKDVINANQSLLNTN
ncbi:PI-PLC X domain-containing protein 3 [Diabrotica virgifera virgifera]|uniref:PI-PLC X domain-containing protein 3-like n=1 Tax=Diabrotica virgifera virgifera TaxID=50390 RepID=A0A6P7F864_DIAVI|nr:PI-PLC X domain-containing protein 3 [Diabrotica virgifera virgifera]